MQEHEGVDFVKRLALCCVQMQTCKQEKTNIRGRKLAKFISKLS